MGDVKLNIYQKKAIMLFGYLDLRFKREYKFDERDRADFLNNVFNLSYE